MYIPVFTVWWTLLVGLISRIPGLHYGFFLFQFFF